MLELAIKFLERLFGRRTHYLLGQLYLANYCTEKKTMLRIIKPAFEILPLQY